MEDSDFDPKIVELATECAYAITGGLSFGWHCVDRMKTTREDDAEWVKAQLLFLIHDCITMK